MTVSGIPMPEIPKTHCMHCGMKLSHAGLWHGLPQADGDGPYCAQCYGYLYPKDDDFVFGKGITVKPSDGYIANLPVHETITQELQLAPPPKAKYKYASKMRSFGAGVFLGTFLGFTIAMALFIFGVMKV